MLHPDETVEHRHVIIKLLRVNGNQISYRVLFIIVEAHIRAKYLWQRAPALEALPAEGNGMVSLTCPSHYMVYELRNRLYLRHYLSSCFPRRSRHSPLLEMHPEKASASPTTRSRQLRSCCKRHPRSPQPR